MRPAEWTLESTAMTNALRVLSIIPLLLLLAALNGCQDNPAGGQPADDDDPVVDDDSDGTVECTVEALAAIEGARIVAEKADGSAILADCVVADGICSMLAPAGIELEIYAEVPNAVSCIVTTMLEPAAAPHEIAIPLGYGGPSHLYDFVYDGDVLGILEVETYCESGKVVVSTHGAGRFEVVGDQLLDIDQMGTSGSVSADLSVYEFSSGAQLIRRP